MMSQNSILSGSLHDPSVGPASFDTEPKLTKELLVLQTGEDPTLQRIQSDASSVASLPTPLASKLGYPDSASDRTQQLACGPVVMASVLPNEDFGGKELFSIGSSRRDSCTDLASLIMSPTSPLSQRFGNDARDAHGDFFSCAIELPPQTA